MRYALIQGRRSAPEPGLKGSCPFCSDPVIAKCGRKRVWHWSHAGPLHCDPWWETETLWHINWKAHFPSSYQEVIQWDDATGEKHIADVKTKTGMVIEFQNSAISPDELRSREVFYKKMFWIVNGSKFKSRFHILARLPNPKEEWVKDIVFLPKKRNQHAALQFYLRSENPPGWTRNEGGLLHSEDEITERLKESYNGHHLFEWLNPRTGWYEATAPVFFDFGGPELWRLKEYDEQGLLAVRRVTKAQLVELNGGEYSDSALR